jgi:L-asparaginase / beta-aspartyl-peptidase
MPGRIGDSPIAGAGGYADNARAAVASTGDGEAFIKLLAAKSVADAIAAGTPPQPACEAMLAELRDRLGATGGLIALDPHGTAGIAFTTPAMPHAWVGDAGAIRSSAEPIDA